jgi:hypothetical protein
MSSSKGDQQAAQSAPEPASQQTLESLLHEQQQPEQQPQQQFLVAPPAANAGPRVAAAAGDSSPMRQMYAVQAPAFEARSALQPRKTDSTRERPPSHTQVDIRAVCNLKRQVLTALPTKCPHCSAEYVAPKPYAGLFFKMMGALFGGSSSAASAGASVVSIVETDCGEIVAYCRRHDAQTTKACGRSYVLFTPPDLTAPEYAQSCVFAATARAHAPWSHGDPLPLKADGSGTASSGTSQELHRLLQSSSKFLLIQVML